MNQKLLFAVQCHQQLLFVLVNTEFGQNSVKYVAMYQQVLMMHKLKFIVRIRNDFDEIKKERRQQFFQ